MEGTQNWMIFNFPYNLNHSMIYSNLQYTHLKLVYDFFFPKMYYLYKLNFKMLYHFIKIEGKAFQRC